MQRQFPLVQHDALPPLPVVIHAVVEHRDVGVLHGLNGAPSH